MYLSPGMQSAWRFHCLTRRASHQISLSTIDTVSVRSVVSGTHTESSRQHARLEAAQQGRHCVSGN
jgi:hypothetical protein